MTTRIFIILISTLTFFSCTSDKKVDPPPLPKYIHDKNRTCEGSEADTFANINDLLKDFYSDSIYRDSFELNLRLGTYYYNHKDYDSSLFYYFKTKNIDSSDSKLYFDIAITYCKLDKFDDALTAINKSLNICDNKWESLNSKCFILYKLNRPQEGVAAGQISLQLNPGNKKIYGNLLHCFDALGQKDSVLKYIDIIETKRTTLPDWYKELKIKYGK